MFPIVLNKLVAALIIGAFVLTQFHLATLHAQEKCDSAITDAETKFNTGNIDEVISILENCLPGNFTQSDKGKAYRILALAYVAKDYVDQAREAIEKLLHIIPTWQADPIEDPPEFHRLIEEVKRKFEAQPQEQLETEIPPPTETPEKPTEQPPVTKRGGSKKFLFFGGGAVVISAVVVLLVGGGGGGGDLLPGPPTLPQDR